MRKTDKIKAEKELLTLIPKYVNNNCWSIEELKNGTFLEVAYERKYDIPLELVKDTPYRAHFIKKVLKKYLKGVDK